MRYDFTKVCICTLYSFNNNNNSLKKWTSCPNWFIDIIQKKDYTFSACNSVRFSVLNDFFFSRSDSNEEQISICPRVSTRAYKKIKAISSIESYCIRIHIAYTDLRTSWCNWYSFSFRDWAKGLLTQKQN